MDGFHLVRIIDKDNLCRPSPMHPDLEIPDAKGQTFNMEYVVAHS